VIAADGDSVLAAIVALQAVTTARGAAAAHVHDRAREMRTRLDRVARDGAMRRAVMVVDDSPAALSGLCGILSGIGVPILAVTHNRTITAGLVASGAADVCVVSDYAEVRGLWRRHRPAVLVIDEHLHDGARDHSGASIVSLLPRGPRTVLVTSHGGARESLDDAARVVQASAIIRTEAGDWTDRLRAEVLRALDDACPPAP
jgi:CheY-like chemotaxis protein